MAKISDDPEKYPHQYGDIQIEIKSKNKIVLRENISNSMQAFTLELLLENMEIYMPNPISVSFYQKFGPEQLKR